MGWLGQAIVLFAVTNIDDLVVLSVFFGRARAEASSPRPVVVGQYVGFSAIVAASVAGAAIAGLLPHPAVAYLGLIPLGIGLWSAGQAWRAWRARGDEAARPAGRVAVWTVALITFANGGDNIGVYVPVFADHSIPAVAGFVAVFLVLVAVWCVAAYLLTAHHRVVGQLARWGHVVYPLALVVIGVVILVEGGAFGRAGR